jgi:UDP:flavonoid glycosyltransferase YjiC (YdhE family)
LVEAPRLLFVPVSGVHGRGEYARSLAIANAAGRRWPAADIRFILSRHAPYAAQSPYPATLLESSPTFHSAAVIAAIETFRPHIVVFDNAGRTAQLLAARRATARVIFISSRPRQRRKAFRWRWMRLLDEHWIAYPEFLAGKPTFLEKFKLDWLRRPVLRFLDVMLSPATPEERIAIAAQMHFEQHSYVLVVPGGGTGHPRAAEAVQRFRSAASALARSGVPTVFVGPGAASTDSNFLSFESLPQAQLGQLMRGARLIVANGGSTLLQAIACGGACIAIAIAKDQIDRIHRCVGAGVAIESGADANSIIQTAKHLLDDEASRAALAKRAADLGLANGVEIAVHALTRLLETN